MRFDALLLAVAAAQGCDDASSSDATSSVDRPNDADPNGDPDPSATTADSDDDPGPGAGSEPGADPSGDPSGDPEDSSGPDDPGSFDDEFDGNEDLLASAGSWQRLFPEQAGSMLEGELPGFLSITASAGAVDNSWYFEHHGAALVKEVAGNFAIMTSLTTASSQGDAEPAGIFNSGGLLIRDVLAAAGDESWMTFNVGRQASAYGRELKKTVASGSNYFLNAQAQNSEHLLVCRLGEQFRFYHWDDVAAAWEAERFDNQVETPEGPMTTAVNDLYDPIRNPELEIPAPGESVALVFEFPGLSATVQVGVMMNSWGAPHDVTSEFDYIRMGSSIPRSPADCTAELSPG